MENENEYDGIERIKFSSLVNTQIEEFDESKQGQSLRLIDRVGLSRCYIFQLSITRVAFVPFFSKDNLLNFATSGL
ncbi:hypothetical protein CHS0354_024208 [Potamilus streckersoni]|uniref:Uncharacterized protein n=1 Tax=Potamilus streckersoni TaxID=2493646 RepID=A0AAE0VM89_9BIVA|nr:hypothetical protein CHS0354_024208 [Potamilus streckersoni]